MSPNNKSDDMRKEYKLEDLGKGVRGKYLSKYQVSHNIVRLSPEVAEVFKDEASVNEALMSLISVAKQSIHLSDDNKFQGTE